ncbi:lipase family protein [Dyella sp.]|uniref:lipase family protein n=1 Tax=Dyella sp. TaxID=1869338 RepID=UPI002D78F858|nr:lipase family protein [Dyella sp.]HET7332957.1 lipase family protein [Dyella sp.]
MATELSPIQAAEIATSTYILRLSDDMDAAGDAAPSISHTFDIPGGVRLTGVTGVGIQKRMGFGFTAWGQGARQGECLIAVRGTHPTSVYDWLSNFRMGGITGPSGYIVHTGFWRAAQSVLPQVARQLRGRTPSALHVVGHSLGGAMATLIADSLSGIGCKVRLYTFGAPRCGLEAHAEYLTSRLGEDDIYRVYHDTDPVPMIPLFPYFHVPYGSNAYRLKGSGTLISVPAHSMPNAYEKSVAGCTWSSLPVILPRHSSFEKASEWLANAAKDSGPFIMRSAAALQLILSALDWILKQVGHAVGAGIGTALFAGTTVLDTLARLLYSGALQSIRLAEAVRNLLSAAMRFMGRAVVATVEITVAFVEYVLGLLFRFLSSMARRALDMFS